MRRALLLGLFVVAAALWQVAARDEAPAGKAAAGTAWSLPRPARSYTLRQGEALFRHYCATCHGENGRGDGFNAYNLDPKPRDLADPTLHAERRDQDLAAVIATGGVAVGLSSAMPPWGRTLTGRQIDQLVHFVRALPEIAAVEDRVD